MTREILTNAQPQSAPATVNESKKAMPAPFNSLSPRPASQDALAGAFPEWDLLPATQFVRRVK